MLRMAYLFVFALLMIAALLIGTKLLYSSRASAMRALAVRFGFRYTKGHPWSVSPGYLPLPTSFRLRGFPLDTMKRTWNVIEGERNGTSLVILDSLLSCGGKRGRYCTFIAVRTDDNPFEETSREEKIAHSNGWTALYRLRFWQIPWTLSIARIEEQVSRLSLTNAPML